MKEIYNLREIVQLENQQYKVFVDNFTEELLKDYKNKTKIFSYKKLSTNPIESPFIKDSEAVMEVDGETYQATQGNILSILIVFKILNKLYNKGVDIENLNEFIFDPSNPEDFNTALDNLYLNFIEEDSIKNLVFEAMSSLAKVSSKFVSGTISLRDIYLLRKNNPELDNILHFKIEDENESFSNMIEDINKNREILKDFLSATDSSYRSMILSGSGFNFKQASQIFNMIGPKPDIFGNIHKHPILTNFLNGLESVDDYYVNADNCRKALLTNYTKVKDSGYLTRILCMLCLDTKLSNTERCDTTVENLPEIFIRNKFILKKYRHRNMWDPELQDYRIVGMDESLIGKKIRVASPMTCSCKDGICKNCYGELHKTVSTIKLSDGRTVKTNIGIVAVLLLTEVLTQMLLSTKHLLEASTDKIDWKIVETDKYFDIYQSSLSLKDKYSLSSVKLINYDDEEDINEIMINEKIIKFPIGVKLNKDFYIAEAEDFDSEYYKLSIINSDDEDVDVPLFTFTVKNKELSDPLNKINSLINSNKIKERDLNGNINYMMELLDIVGFKISSEHIEVIMRELINIDDRSKFSQPNPEYEFVGAKAKVMSDSITKSLLFEKLKPQLLDAETYEKNNEDSLLDFLL